MHHTALAQPLARSVAPASRPSLAVVRDEIGASTVSAAVRRSADVFMFVILMLNF